MRVPASTELWNGTGCWRTHAKRRKSPERWPKASNWPYLNGGWSGTPAQLRLPMEGLQRLRAECKADRRSDEPELHAAGQRRRPHDRGRRIGDQRRRLGRRPKAIRPRRRASRGAPQFTEYPLPNGSAPKGIAAGPEAATVWFTDLKTAEGRQDHFLAARITEYSPSHGYKRSRRHRRAPTAICGTPEAVQHKTVDRSPPSGTITEYAADPRRTVVPKGIAAGPDGNLWFTE